MLRRADSQTQPLAPLPWWRQPSFHHNKLLPAQTLLGTPKSRDIFLDAFEQVRKRYRFDVMGFVVMPEHVHLLISEPARDNPSIVMQVLKQTVARRLLHTRRKRNSNQQELWSYAEAPARFWQRRFYDFNVYSDVKMTEKLGYMHRNPVKGGAGAFPGTLEMEQRSRLCLWRAWPSEDGLCLPPSIFPKSNGVKSQG